MSFPLAPEMDENAAAHFRSMSDTDFARLSTEEKFRHIRLGMQELARTLAELDSAVRDGSHGE